MSPSEAYHKSLFGATKVHFRFVYRKLDPVECLCLFTGTVSLTRARACSQESSICREPVRNVLV